MSESFAGSEIVELGIQIEINGRDFYSSLAAQAKEARTKETFAFLAGEEEKHIATFRQILDSVRTYEPEKELSDEYVAYMNSLAGTYLFTGKDKGKEAAGSVRDEKEAIDLGIGFEKDSVHFYENMKKAVPEKEQGLVDQLIAEERHHIERLTTVRESLG